MADLAMPGSGMRADIWNDTIYLTGGTDWIQAVDLAPDGLTGTGRTVQQLPYWVRYAPTFVSGNSLYVAGGQLQNGDYTSASWRMPINGGGGAEGAVVASGSFPEARLGQSPQPFSNGRHYLATGLPFVDTMEFDPGAGGSWSIVGSVPTPRFVASVESYQDKLYTFGGRNQASEDVAVTEVGRLIACTDLFVDSNGTPNGGGTVNVTVGGEAVSVTFPAGTTGGPLVCALMPSPPADLPSGFKTGGKVFEIASGSNNIAWPVTLTLPYNGSATNPGVAHWNGSQWEVTRGIGTRQYDVEILSVGSGTITFTAWSMSPFALEGMSSEPMLSVPAASWWTLAVAALVGIALVARRRALAV